VGRGRVVARRGVRRRSTRNEAEKRLSVSRKIKQDLKNTELEIVLQFQKWDQESSTAVCVRKGSSRLALLCACEKKGPSRWREKEVRQFASAVCGR